MDLFKLIVYTDGDMNIHTEIKLNGDVIEPIKYLRKEKEIEKIKGEIMHFLKEII